ncbi:MAG: DUF1549 domain-containing protein [Planctomycetes bacterium]|nr:DUF1549 domain-containing protein [Planctomycetota bacterium]
MLHTLTRTIDRTPIRRVILAAAMLLAASTLVRGEAALKSVVVMPDAVNLNTLRDRQSFVVQATYDDGITRDVTNDAKLSFADASLVKVEGHVIHPAKDGQTQMFVEYGGQKLTVPVNVKDAQTERPISFRLDVMPVFAKAGCNSGSCHGSASGKDGFHLSLFGYDPAGDYYRITREMSGRRINLALPAESLLVEKAIGKVNHTGGELFKPETEYYATLVRWLEAGAPDDVKDVAKCVGIEMYPHKLVMDGAGAAQQMTVLAHYTDGTDRDVTRYAVFMSNNDVSCKIDPEGQVVAGQRGEAYVMARFDEFTVGSNAIVLPKGLQYAWQDVKESNYIDELVDDKLKKLRITPSPLCSDETFLRRATIDIIGSLPTRAEYDKFMADTDPDKRAKLVDDLLSRKEFVEMWVMKFSELLQISSDNNAGNQALSYKAALLYYNWMSEQLANNVPMNQIVQQLLSSSGGTFSVPATNFYQVERDDKKLAENVAQVFMGMRIQCAQCHNHPFDRWTMDDYYSFVSFFTQVGRKNAEDPREQIIFNKGNGDIRHPVDNRVMEPKFLGGASPDVKGKDRRVVLAEWLASPDNPYFAKNLANIVWSHFFGRGIVEPVDDVRVSNPAVNPELLDALGKKFTEYNYDFKKLVRDICTSRTYQLSTVTNDSNESDGTNFSHSYIRRMRAEVLFDSISEVTDTMDENKFRGLPKGSRAVQIADGATSTYFLKTFGRAERESVCSCEVKMEPNLSQALHLLNGDTVERKIKQGKIVEQALKDGKTPEQIVEDLYIRCFGRKPTADEAGRISQMMKDAKDPRQELEDLFWALLNSKEFLFNH